MNMIAEILVLLVVLIFSITTIVLSWRKQQKKQYLRHMEWMTENLKEDRRLHDDSTNHG